MSIFDFFKTPADNSADLALERLQIVVSHTKNHSNPDKLLERLQQAILESVSKIIDIDEKKININLERQRGLLELNVTLPDEKIG